MKDLELKFRELILRVTKRDAQWEKLFGLNGPTSQHVRRLVSIFTLQRSIGHPKQKPFTNVNSQSFRWFLFLATTYQEITQRARCIGSKNLDETELVGTIDDEGLKEELQTCKRFLVDSEMENMRHKMFNFAMKILDADTLRQKLDRVFEKLKCAAKLIVAFGFTLKNSEDGNCRHENNTLIKTCGDQRRFCKSQKCVE